MFQSVVAAASAEDGKVVGVDVDQSSESDTVVTSAMKGLSDAAEWAIAKVYDGTWDEIGNNATALGVKENAVGLPTATWSMENFTVADYEDLFQQVLNGDGIFKLAKIGISAHFYRMLPYIVTLLVLAFTSKSSRAPKAEGIPYDKGQR